MRRPAHGLVPFLFAVAVAASGSAVGACDTRPVYPIPDDEDASRSDPSPAPDASDGDAAPDASPDSDAALSE